MTNTAPTAPSAAQVLRGMSPAQRDALVRLATLGSREWFRVSRATRQALLTRGVTSSVDGGGRVPNSFGLEVVEAEKARRLLVTMEARVRATWAEQDVPAEVTAKLAELRVRAGK